MCNVVLRLLLGSSFLILLMFADLAQACSSFMLKSDGRVVVGRNFDWGTDVSGLLIVNKRGIAKRGLPWGEVIGPSNEPMNTPSWVSKYGSVTFTAFAREFPDNGMNEAGLVIEEMTLGRTQYPQSRTKPTLSTQQWMQYQLDNFATVKEVIAHVDDIDPRGAGLHFLVADATGDCATIEFINGKPVIHTGGRLPVPVLTNEPYAETLASLKQYTGFGGRRPIPDSGPGNGGSEARFTEAAYLLKNYPRQTWPDPVHLSFAVLQEIGGLDHGTRRQIVHDITNRRIWFETSTTRTRRYVDLNTFDFSPQTPVLVLDLDAKLSGNVSDAFTEYDADEHREIVREIFRVLVTNPDTTQIISNELIKAGATLDEWIDTLATYPDSTHPSHAQSP